MFKIAFSGITKTFPKSRFEISIFANSPIKIPLFSFLNLALKNRVSVFESIFGEIKSTVPFS